MIVRVGKEKISLTDADLLGAGGEARVFRWRNLALKIFHAENPRKLLKVAQFPSGLPAELVAPLDLCTDPKGRTIGYTMRRIEGAEDLLRLSQRSFREGVIANGEVTALFRHLRAVVEKVHARGVVIGDFNDGNVLFKGRETFLIDADSMQFSRFACEVGHERFLDPRLYGVDLRERPCFSMETDWYAFAVLLFASLLYVHPYGGLHKSLPTLLRRAEARCSILRPEVQVPRAAVHWRVLPDDLLGWFERVFEKDERSPFFPEPLLELQWSRCRCGLEHARPVCPACASLGVVAARTALRISGRCAGRTVVRTHGRILAAAVQGGIQYLVDEDGVIRRENGEVVLREPRRPGMVFALAGRATWVGLGDRLLRIENEQVTARAGTATFQGRPAFAAAALGLHRIDGDWLMENDTRSGSILNGQTWLAAGERLGVGCYRAGLLTFWFLFRRGCAGLTSLPLPAIDGKLIDLTAVFDDRHALVGVATEKNGQRTHSLYLVDDSGKLRARAVGAPDSSRMLASIHGKALDQGRVVGLTDEGLLSLSIDEKVGLIGEGRLFTDTAPFSAADAELLVGPGGSLYVVTTQEIVQLTIQ
jgi:hypothetical protein